jgi:hypothetical protein
MLQIFLYVYPRLQTNPHFRTPLPSLPTEEPHAVNMHSTCSRHHHCAFVHPIIYPSTHPLNPMLTLTPPSPAPPPQRTPCPDTQGRSSRRRRRGPGRTRGSGRAAAGSSSPGAARIRRARTCRGCGVCVVWCGRESRVTHIHDWEWAERRKTQPACGRTFRRSKRRWREERVRVCRMMMDMLDGIRRFNALDIAFIARERAKSALRMSIMLETYIKSP